MKTYLKLDGNNALGHSSWGVFYRGCEINSQSEYTILEIAPYLLESKIDIWELAHDTAERVKHPFFVSVVDVSKENKWLILERRSKSLSQFMPLPQYIVRVILSQSLVLLDHFNKCQFVHGDIRTDMFYLPFQINQDLHQNNCQFKLGYSLGAMLDGLVLTRDRNFKYFAPEMIDSKYGEICIQTDMYCLAFSMLELLIGKDFDSKFQRLNDTNEDDTWVYLHGSGDDYLDEEKLRELYPEISYDICVTLAAMLKKKVSDRPSNPLEILEQLDFNGNPTSFSYPEISSEPLEQTNYPVQKDVSQLIKNKDNDRGLHASNKTKTSQDVKTTEKVSPLNLVYSYIESPVLLYPLISLVIVCLLSLLTFLGVDSVVRLPLATSPVNTVISVIEQNNEMIFPKNLYGYYKIPKGLYTLTFGAKGYSNFSTKVNVLPNGTILDDSGKSLVIPSLEPKKYNFSIEGAPLNCELYLDGVFHERAPDRLEHGFHEVVIKYHASSNSPIYQIFADKEVVLKVGAPKTVSVKESEKIKVQEELFYKMISAFPLLWKEYGCDSIKQKVMNEFQQSFDPDLSEEKRMQILEQCCKTLEETYIELFCLAYRDPFFELAKMNKDIASFINHTILPYQKGQNLQEVNILKMQLGIFQKEESYTTLPQGSLYYNMLKGDHHFCQQNYSDALNFYEKAVTIMETQHIPLSLRMKASLYQQLGVCEFNSSDKTNNKVLNNYNKAANVLKKHEKENLKLFALLSLNRACYYYEMKEFNEVINQLVLLNDFKEDTFKETTNDGAEMKPSNSLSNTTNKITIKERTDSEESLQPQTLVNTDAEDVILESQQKRMKSIPGIPSEKTYIKMSSVQIENIVRIPDVYIGTQQKERVRLLSEALFLLAEVRMKELDIKKREHKLNIDNDSDLSLISDAYYAYRFAYYFRNDLVNNGAKTDIATGRNRFVKDLKSYKPMKQLDSFFINFNKIQYKKKKQNEKQQ